MDEETIHVGDLLTGFYGEIYLCIEASKSYCELESVSDYGLVRLSTEQIRQFKKSCDSIESFLADEEWLSAPY